MGFGRWTWMLAGIFVSALALSASVLSNTSRVSIHHAALPAHRRALLPKAIRGVESGTAVRNYAPEHGRAPLISAQPAAVSAEHAQAVGRASLPWKLIGTSSSEFADQALALFENLDTHVRQSCRLGDWLQNRRLVQVGRDYVILESGDIKERVELEASGETKEEASTAPVDAQSPWQPVIERIFRPAQVIGPEQTAKIKAAIETVSPTEHVVRRALVQEAVKDSPLQIMQEARMVPAFEGTRLVGIRLAVLADQGVLERSGFKSGDLIKQVNGQPATDPGVLLKLPQQLAQTPVVEVAIERDGQPVTLTFRMQ